jgi:O-antigen/teichoic acid export membrane protein
LTLPWNRAGRIGIELVLIIVGQALAVAGSMVGIRMLTERLGPSLYGELALGLTLGGVVTQLAMGPLQQGILRFFSPASEAGEIKPWVRAVVRLLLRASLFLAVVLIGIIAILSVVGRDFPIAFIAIAVVLAFLSGYERTVDATHNAARRRGVTAWHQALNQWLRVALAVLFIAWLGTSSTVALAGYAIATLIVLISQLIIFLKRHGRSLQGWRQGDQAAVTRRWESTISAYSWPFMTWGMFLWLQQSSDRWALGVFRGAADVGFYTVLQQLGYAPVLLVTGVLVQLLQPIVYGRAGDGTDALRMESARRLNRTLLMVFLVITAVGALLAALLHAQVFGLIVAPQFHSVSHLMPWLVLAAGLFACGELAALLLMIGTQTKSLIAPKIGVAVVGVVFNIAGAWLLGLPGVVFASVIFSATSFVVMLYLATPAASRGVAAFLRVISPRRI